MKARTRILVVGALLAVLGVVGGFLVAVSGIVPLKASSGHWAVTEWFLQLGKRRSIATHTVGMEDLRLDEPWLVLKGAGHYESGCRPCHGSPGVRIPRIAAAMLPLPPYLPPRIAEWDPEELFYIVKHGIKFTGMPAWQTQQRDDEVRAIVAFLLEMPDLTRASYERLVYGEAPAEPSVVPLEDIADPEQPPGPVTESCARCHGTDGLGRGNAAFPKLAGQRPEYLHQALEAYASGGRHSGIMAPIAAGLAATDRRTLADYYADLPPGSPAADGDGGSHAAERGRSIALRGAPSLGVPSCADCHGPADHPRNPAYPSLAGQYAEYLVLQLELFRSRARGGSEFSPLMHHVVDGLEPQQIRDVAAYYAALDPGAPAGR